MEDPKELLQIRIQTIIQNNFDEVISKIHLESRAIFTTKSHTGAWIIESCNLADSEIRNLIKETIAEIDSEVPSGFKKNVQEFWEEVEKPLKDRTTQALKSFQATWLTWTKISIERPLVEKLGQVSIGLINQIQKETASRVQRAKLLISEKEIKSIQKQNIQPKENKDTQKAERWKIVKSLGEGGQAYTYVVLDSNDQKNYVLKRLKNINRLPRFKTEIETIKRLNHPNIIKLYDYDLEAEKPYFISEFCEDGSIENTSFSHDRAFKLFHNVCSGLIAAHSAGVTHRDIKPANIFLRSNQAGVLADFGLCYVIEGERHTVVDEAVGPRIFMAPELEDGRLDDIKPSADIYSLGKLLYWLLSGSIFSREKHREPKYDLVTKFGHSYEHINLLLDKMIQFDPEKRYQNASEVLKEFEQKQKLLDSKYNVINKNASQICNYCGSGSYELKVDGANNDARNFGIIPVGNPLLKILVCNNCGHVQIFRLDMAENKNWL